MDGKVREIHPTGATRRVLRALKVVVDLNPVAVWVFQVNLPDSVHPFGNGESVAAPVFVMDALRFQFLEQFVHFTGRKAEVGIFFSFGWCCPAGNQVEMCIFANAEPGMAAIVKRFGDGIQTNNITVKDGAGFEVGNIQGYVVDPDLHGAFVFGSFFTG